MDTNTLRINGEPLEVPGGLTVDQLLAHLGRDPSVSGVAVAVDERVVRRSAWTETTVEDGARVEIITAAQGG